MPMGESKIKFRSVIIRCDSFVFPPLEHLHAGIFARANNVTVSLEAMTEDTKQQKHRCCCAKTKTKKTMKIMKN